MRKFYSRLYFLQIIICFFWCITAIANNGQPGDMYFKKISVGQGLSQASVNAFVEDQLGFIWVATDNGLNRFDGVNFTTFRWKKGREDGLSNSMVQDLAEDEAGNIWIGTAGGLNKYDPRAEKFIQYHDSTNINISNILIDTSENKIWMAATADGLKYLDLNTQKIHAISSDLLQETVVWDILKTNKNELLVATMGNGIFKVNTHTMDISPFLNNANGLPVNSIRDMLVKNDQLVVGTLGGGVFLYNLKTNAHEIFNQENSGLRNNEVTCLAFDNENSLMIGTDGGGLNILNIHDYSIASYEASVSNPRSISSNVIRAIFKDQKGNYWFGTYKGGINFVNRTSTHVKHIGKQILNKNSISNNSINCFLQDAEGLWIGTDGGGLNYLNNGIFKVINKGNTARDLNDIVVMCIDKAQDGAVLIGTYRGGLNIYRNGRIEKFVHDASDSFSIVDNCIWDIEVDNDGNYWVGTNSGLNKFDPKTKQFTRYKLRNDFEGLTYRNNVRSLYLDKDDKLWIGFFEGFGMFDIRTNKFEYFINHSFDNCGLSNDIVISILEDHDENLWLGTFGGGLNRFDKRDKTFEVYSEEDGFPSQIVLSMEEDSNHNLWISTTNGLVKFNPELSMFQTLDPSIGLQGEVFKHKSSFLDKNGYMYFGGVNGYNVFHPDSIDIPNNQAPVIITDFKLFSNSISPRSHSQEMDQSILFTKDLELDYKESRFITVQFTRPDYESPSKLDFAYKLEGFDKEWNYIGGQRNLTFTNLKPGNYTLKIKSSSNNIWTSEFRELHMKIVPPFYLTKGFIFFSVIMLVGGVLAVVKYRTHILTKRQSDLELLIDQKNAEIKQQNHDLVSKNMKLTEAQKQLRLANNSLEDKVNNRTRRLKKTVDQLNKTIGELDRFVYSASHDISAPLKSIKGLVHIARHDNQDQNLTIHLNYIEESIIKLEQVIEELIQFSRNARSDLEYVDIDLNVFVNEIVDSLKFMPEYNRLQFDISIPQNTIIRSDRQRMQMVVHNLLSNAIKYQDLKKEHRKACVKYSHDGDWWSLEIGDNGIGISEMHRKNVFQMFYRATEKASGSGLGLFIAKEAMDKLGASIHLKSKENLGTMFHLIFPNGNSI